MERKRAMAVAATVTCVLGSSTVALAATAGVPVLGFGRSAADAAEVSTVWQASTAHQARRVVTRTKNVVDKVVVDVPEGGGATVTPPNPTTAPATPAPVATTYTPRPSTTAAAPHRQPRTEDDDAPPTTAHTPVTHPPEPVATSTTTLITTTTTRPPGVPADWPPGKPIPPMPPNCHNPQLEDNGVWNCQDD